MATKIDLVKLYILFFVQTLDLGLYNFNETLSFIPVIHGENHQ